MKPSREAGIDTLRGLACLLLVSLHVIGEAPTHGLHVADDHPLALFAELFFHLRMPMFAMLSGFVYAARPVRPREAGAFARGKARRLVLPFLFAASAFAILMTVLDGSWAVEPARFWTVYVLPYAHFWFLQALVLIFLAVALFDLALPRAPQWAAALFLALSAGLFLSGAGRGVEWMSLDRALYLAPFFGFGLLLARLSPGAVKRIGLVCLALGAILFTLHAAQVLAEPSRDIARRTAMALGVGLTMSGTLLAFRFSVAPLAFAGRRSFTIYLYHLFAVMGFQLVYHVTGWPNPWLGLALGLIAGIAAPIVLHALVLRLGGPLPLMMLGLRAKRRDAPARTAARAV